MSVRWVPPSDEYKRKHPEYFQRSDVPSRAKVRRPQGKVWVGVGGGAQYLTAPYGKDEKGRTLWGTWCLDGIGGGHKEPTVGVSVRRGVAERKLEAFAKRLGLREFGR